MSRFVLYSMVGAQGLLGYGLAAVFGAIPAELFPGKRSGTIVGTLNVTSNAGAACGPWLTGVLYDAPGTYGLGFVVAMGMSGVSILAMWIAAPPESADGRWPHLSGTGPAHGPRIPIESNRSVVIAFGLESLEDHQRSAVTSPPRVRKKATVEVRYTRRLSTFNARFCQRDTSIP